MRWTFARWSIFPLVVAVGLFAVVSAHAYGSYRLAERNFLIRMPEQSTVDLEHIVRQTTDKTCGPATLATLLYYYFGKSVTEEELYDDALRAMLGEQYENMPVMPSVTFRGLMGALASHGFAGYPVQTTFDDLHAYFQRHDIPVILRIHHPTPHFTLLLGVVDNLFVLSDSLLGHVTMSGKELASHWDNYALFVVPEAESTFHRELRLKKLSDVQQRLELLKRTRAFI